MEDPIVFGPSLVPRILGNSQVSVEMSAGLAVEPQPGKTSLRRKADRSWTAIDFTGESFEAPGRGPMYWVLLISTTTLKKWRRQIHQSPQMTFR